MIWIDAVDHQIKAAGYHHPLLGRVGCDTRTRSSETSTSGPGSSRTATSRSTAGPRRSRGCSSSPSATDRRRQCDGEPSPTGSTRSVDLDDEWVARVDAVAIRRARTAVPAPAPSGSGTRRPTAAQPAPACPSPETTPAPTAAADRRSTRAPATRPKPVDAMPRSPRGCARRRQSSSDCHTPRRTACCRCLPAAARPARACLLARRRTTSSSRGTRAPARPSSPPTARPTWSTRPSTTRPARSSSGQAVARASGRPNRGLRPSRRGTDPAARADEQVRVTHLAELMAETTDIKGPWPGAIGGEHDDVDAQARLFAERAAGILEAHVRSRAGKGAARENVKAVYELIALQRHQGPAAGQRPRPDRVDEEAAARSTRRSSADTCRSWPRCRLAYKPIPETDRTTTSSWTRRRSVAHRVERARPVPQARRPVDSRRET